MRNRAIYPIVASALVLAACDSATGPVEWFEGPSVTATAEVVTVGQTVPIRIANDSRVRWSYNLCGSASVERRIVGGWEPSGPPLTICPAVLNTVGPGSVVDGLVYVPLGLQPGEYRVMVRFTRSGDEANAPSNGFIVESLPPA